MSAAWRNGNGKPTPEYTAYCRAKNRCDNPNHARYEDYGGRDIKFLFTSFGQFLAEVGLRPEGRFPSGRPLYSLHRINNDGNYEPGNVKWATAKEQQEPGARRRQRTTCPTCPILSETERIAKLTGLSLREINKRARDVRAMAQVALARLGMAGVERAATLPTTVAV
jgi:hypothetical protein